MNFFYVIEEMCQVYWFYVSVVGSEVQVGEIFGQVVFDVDDFKDICFGGWWVGYEYVLLWGVVLGIVNYILYWYFFNLVWDGDFYGNFYGGYDYCYYKVDGGIVDVDWYVMVYFYNCELKCEDFDIIEVYYCQGICLDWQEYYGDFQIVVFQLIDNFVIYWFEQFCVVFLLQIIGYVLYVIGDVVQLYYVWIILVNGYFSWEGWVDDYYVSEKFNDLVVVVNLVGCYDLSKSICDLFIQIGQVVYVCFELFYDISYEMCLWVVKELIFEFIVLIVIVLIKGVNSFDVLIVF